MAPAQIAGTTTPMLLQTHGLFTRHRIHRARATSPEGIGELPDRVGNLTTAGRRTCSSHALGGCSTRSSTHVGPNSHTARGTAEPGTATRTNTLGRDSPIVASRGARRSRGGRDAQRRAAPTPTP